MAYECKYCAKIFARETSFMKHKCPEMKRSEDIKTPVGIAAYNMYEAWMRLSNRKPPPIETFSTSRYFNTLVKFVQWAHKLKLPKPEEFIKLMVDRNMSPMLWCRDECYSLYLEWIDRKSDPLDQATISVDLLYRVAEAANAEVTNVFQILNCREVMQLIRQRQLSPWLLLCSKEFKAFLVGLDPTEREELLNLIGYSYWADKFDKNPLVVEQMKMIANELGI